MNKDTGAEQKREADVIRCQGEDLKLSDALGRQTSHGAQTRNVSGGLRGGVFCTGLFIMCSQWWRAKFAMCRRPQSVVVRYLLVLHLRLSVHIPFIVRRKIISNNVCNHVKKLVRKKTFWYTDFDLWTDMLFNLLCSTCVNHSPIFTFLFESVPLKELISCFLRTMKSFLFTYRGIMFPL